MCLIEISHFEVHVFHRCLKKAGNRPTFCVFSRSRDPTLHPVRVFGQPFIQTLAVNVQAVRMGRWKIPLSDQGSFSQLTA